MSNDDNKNVDRKLSSLTRFGLRGRGRAGAGAGPSRLPSIKPARDLTLGGTPKRTFTPNIVARSIKKENDIKTEDGSRARHVRNHRGKERGRGRGGRGRGDIISSSGIFSQGPAAQQTLAKALTGGGFMGGSSRDNDNSSSSSRTFIHSVKGEKEEELDSDKIFETLNDEGKIELDENEIKSGNLIPITLPLASKLMQKIKHDLKTDSELTQDEDETPKVKTLKKPIQKNQESYQPSLNIADLFVGDGANGQLFFLQLPDTLPVQALSHEDDDVEIEPAESSTTTKTVDESEELLKKFTFQNVSEGHIGKLQIHSSGKVTMRLGNVILDVSLGTPCGFLQDLISVHTEKEPSEMISLGHVNHRLIAVPDYEALLGGCTDELDTEDDEDT